MGGQGAKPHKDKTYSNFELQARILCVISAELEEVPLKKLSISMICSRAEISRPTFYRYFHDKYSVFNWYLRMTMHSSLMQVGIMFNWEESLQRFCQSLQANRLLCQRFFVDRSKFSSFFEFNNLLVESFSRNVEARFETPLDVPERLRFQILAFSRMLALAVCDWLESDENVGLFCEDVISVIPGDLYELLNVSSSGESFNDAFRDTTDSSPLLSYVVEATA